MSSSQTWRRRGWTLQEEALARRILFFAVEGLRSQLIWSCKQCLWTEDGNYQDARHLASDVYNIHRWTTTFTHYWSLDVWGLSENRPPPAEYPYQPWYDAVEEYSGRELTNWSDRLIAIEGLKDVFSASSEPTLAEDFYFCGLWEGDISAGICWRTTGSYRRDPTAAEKRAQFPRGLPSWSWASSLMSVEWEHHGVSGWRYAGSKPRRQPDFKIETDREAMMKGRLKVTGQLTTAPLKPRDDSPVHKSIFYPPHNYDKNLRADDDDRPTPAEYFLLFVDNIETTFPRHTRPGFRFIALEKRHNGDFARLGFLTVFRGPKGTFDPEWSEKCGDHFALRQETFYLV